MTLSQLCSRTKYWNLVCIWLLCLVLMGGFYFEFVLCYVPCPLCFHQRLGMIGIASGLFLNVHFAVHPRNYAIALLFSCFGMGTALRHIALNVCSSSTMQGHMFGPYHLYTWSFLVFFCSILGSGLFLFFYKPEISSFQLEKKKQKKLSFLGLIPLLVIVLIGTVAVFQKCKLSL